MESPLAFFMPLLLLAPILTNRPDGVPQPGPYACEGRVYSIVDLTGSGVDSVEARWRGPDGRVREITQWKMDSEGDRRVMFFLEFAEPGLTPALFTTGSEKNNGEWAFELAAGSENLARVPFEVQCEQ